jgi:hypothetical protein
VKTPSRRIDRPTGEKKKQPQQPQYEAVPARSNAVCVSDAPRLHPWFFLFYFGMALPQAHLSSLSLSLSAACEIIVLAVCQFPTTTSKFYVLQYCSLVFARKFE